MTSQILSMIVGESVVVADANYPYISDLFVMQLNTKWYYCILHEWNRGFFRIVIGIQHPAVL